MGFDISSECSNNSFLPLFIPGVSMSPSPNTLLELDDNIHENKPILIHAAEKPKKENRSHIFVTKTCNIGIIGIIGDTERFVANSRVANASYHLKSDVLSFLDAGLLFQDKSKIPIERYFSNERKDSLGPAISACRRLSSVIYLEDIEWLLTNSSVASARSRYALWREEVLGKEKTPFAFDSDVLRFLAADALLDKSKIPIERYFSARSFSGLCASYRYVFCKERFVTNRILTLARYSYAFERFESDILSFWLADAILDKSTIPIETYFSSDQKYSLDPYFYVLCQSRSEAKPSSCYPLWREEPLDKGKTSHALDIALISFLIKTYLFSKQKDSFDDYFSVLRYLRSEASLRYRYALGREEPLDKGKTPFAFESDVLSFLHERYFSNEQKDSLDVDSGYVCVTPGSYSYASGREDVADKRKNHFAFDSEADAIFDKSKIPIERYFSSEQKDSLDGYFSVQDRPIYVYLASNVGYTSIIGNAGKAETVTFPFVGAGEKQKFSYMENLHNLLDGVPIPSFGDDYFQDKRETISSNANGSAQVPLTNCNFPALTNYYPAGSYSAECYSYRFLEAETPPFTYH